MKTKGNHNDPNNEDRVPLNVEMMDEKAAAHFLGITSQRTLSEWRWRKEGPPYIKIGRSIRYSRSDLQEYIDSRRIVPANDSQ